MSLSTDRRASASSIAASLLSACLSAFLIVAGCERAAPGPGGLDEGEGSGEEDAALDAGAPDASAIDAAAPDASAPDAGEVDGGADASCDALSCDAKCGPVYDPCLQKTIQCGACKDASKVCDIETHRCIEPKSSCSALGAQCGTVKTSCGIHISCGDCPASQWCDPQTHQCTTCTPVTCQDLGYECGSAWNGCGPYAANLSCGDCANSEVCNTALHVCEPACTAPSDATVCAAAKANGVECGYVTNGCGGLANCGGCPNGQRCGTRGVANRCEPEETSVECLVLGQNCGTLQSACGNTVSCGTCSGTDVCNANGVCGPRCVPQTCASADYQGKCGVGLDDGCAGKLRCDCASGKACSTLVSGGVGTCGDFKACSSYTENQTPTPCSNGADPDFPKGDGTNLSCPCTVSGAVCISGIDGNGTVVSGSATGHCCKNTNSCAPGSCNTSYVDTCTGATVPCNTCSSSQHCEGTTCVENKTCSTYDANGAAGNPCSANPSFDRGDGHLFTCGCWAGICSSGGHRVTGAEKGTCCLNPNAGCDGIHCNDATHPYAVLDGCTGDVTICRCNSANYCVDGMCQLLETCASYTDQKLGNPCSNGAAPDFPKGDGTNLTCRCTDSGAVCISGADGSGTVVSGGDTGHCCKNTNSCAPGSCNTSYVDTCTGATVSCNTCSSSQHCEGTTCVANNTCATFTDQKLGHPCSNGADPDFPRGNGTNLTCKCTDSGAVCISGTEPNGAVVSGATTGHCCKNTNSCSPGSCNTSYLDTCTGATVPCNTCSSSQHCEETACVANKTCSTYGANGAAGSPCSVNPAFDRGDGQLIACGCTSPGVCSTGGALVTGANKGTCCVNTVACAADACATSVVNPCTGAAIPCPSTCSDPNKHCDSAQKKCVDNATCSTHSANGKIGDKCSTVASTAFPKGDGSNLTCGCSQSGGPSGEATPNIQCTGSSASAAGTCTCVPTSCTVLGAGPHPNDGCGKAINCSG
jgi:hypothetical protein